MSQDEDKPQLRPIPGAPPGAPNPPFPVEGKDQPTPKEPEAQRVHGPDSIPGPNEIADRLEDLKPRMRYAEKLGLETACEIAKLLMIMVDVHKYKGKRYESFAIAHGAGNRTYAYALYRLGLVADDVILKCEAEERINPRFHYPHWLKMVPPKPPDEEETSEPDEDEPAEPNPIAELQRERNNLEVQVKAATQQYPKRTRQTGGSRRATRRSATASRNRDRRAEGADCGWYTGIRKRKGAVGTADRVVRSTTTGLSPAVYRCR